MSTSNLRPESRHYPKEGLSDPVRRGLEYFIGIHNGTSLNQTDRRLISPFIERVLISRTKRASEISSSDYLKVINLLMTIFNNPDIFGVDCIDGRVLPVFVAGIIAKFGGMIRVPAGDLTEFKRKDGQTVLLDGSNFAKRLEEAFKNRGVNHITQIFDSHLHCAAREKEENSRSRFPSDHGLYVDVKRKKEMADATMKYVEGKNVGKRKVTPIQLSFNPHTGYLYMGLETGKAMKKAEKKANVFFDESQEAIRQGRNFDLLKDMAGDGDIISTELLSKDPGIRKFLDPERFDVDWENHYARTAENFWKKIAKLQKTSLYATLKIKLAGIYPEIAKLTDGRAEIEDRATIVLANLFGTYCLTKGGSRPFPHHEHREEIGVASEGGYGPFSEIPSFGINILDQENLATNTKLAYDIILSNRKKENIPTRKDAPIVVMVQHIIRTGPTDPIWKELNDAELQKQLKTLPDVLWFGKNWIEMDDKEFNSCMKTNFNIKNSKIIQELNKLRYAMMALYKDPNTKDPLAKLFPQFKDKTDDRPRLIILPVLADQNRSTQAVLPFMSNNVSR